MEGPVEVQVGEVVGPGEGIEEENVVGEWHNLSGRSVLIDNF